MSASVRERDSFHMIWNHAASATSPHAIEMARIETRPKPNTLYQAACRTRWRGKTQ